MRNVNCALPRDAFPFSGSAGLAACSDGGLVGESTASFPVSHGGPVETAGTSDLASLAQQLKALQRQHFLLQQQLCRHACGGGGAPVTLPLSANGGEGAEDEDEDLPTADDLRDEKQSLSLPFDGRIDETFAIRGAAKAQQTATGDPSESLNNNNRHHQHQHQQVQHTQRGDVASPSAPDSTSSRVLLLSQSLMHSETRLAASRLRRDAARVAALRALGPAPLSYLLGACANDASSSATESEAPLASPSSDVEEDAIVSSRNESPIGRFLPSHIETAAIPLLSSGGGAALRQKRAGNCAFADVRNSLPEVRQRLAGTAKKPSVSISDVQLQEEQSPLQMHLRGLGGQLAISNNNTNGFKSNRSFVNALTEDQRRLSAASSSSSRCLLMEGNAGGTRGCIIKSSGDENPPISKLMWSGGTPSGGGAARRGGAREGAAEGESQLSAGFVRGSSNSNSLKLPPSASDSSTCGPPSSSAISAGEAVQDHLILYRGPEEMPTCLYRRLFDPEGPVQFSASPLLGALHPRGELRLWPRVADRIISQNSSKRKVHRACWLSPLAPDVAFPVAVKFVEDGNVRDGRSIKREIECHLYIYQRLSLLQRLQHQQEGKSPALGDVWPCAELLGYFLNRKEPGQSVLVTRKLSGPDFFDVIRAEHSSSFNINTSSAYAQHKLQWCCLALERVAQYAHLGIRHNDIKPDNIVLDFYAAPDSNERLLDVKLIDLGTACMQGAKDFTGGTSWYESPEQKILEFHTKKHRNPEVAKQVDIGLPSDAWGAGISITEVLMGRRVVDVLRAPHGPGPLEFRGAEEGWVLDPDLWIAKARAALGMDAPQQRFPVCAAAARLVFGMLVKARPEERSTVQNALTKLRQFIRETSADPNSVLYSELYPNQHSQTQQVDRHPEHAGHGQAQGHGVGTGLAGGEPGVNG